MWRPEYWRWLQKSQVINKELSGRGNLVKCVLCGTKVGSQNIEDDFKSPIRSQVVEILWKWVKQPSMKTLDCVLNKKICMWNQSPPTLCVCKSSFVIHPLQNSYRQQRIWFGGKCGCDDKYWLSAWSTWEEEASIEDLLSLDWPVIMSVGHCWDCWLVRRAQPIVGGTLSGQLSLVLWCWLDHRKQASRQCSFMVSA